MHILYIHCKDINLLLEFFFINLALAGIYKCNNPILDDATQEECNGFASSSTSQPWQWGTGMVIISFIISLPNIQSSI